MSLLSAISDVPELFFHCAGYLQVPDIGRSTQVSTRWKGLLEDRLFWIFLSKREGIPLVEGEGRNLKHDFSILYPMTISKKLIRQYFGEPMGEIPRIRLSVFNKLQDSDPFQLHAKIRENYVFVVIPSHIARTVDENTPLELNESGHLVISTAIERKTLKIPFSLMNLKMLCKYPLKGSETIFNDWNFFSIFEKCGLCPNKVTICFMRIRIADQTRSMLYPQQEGLVKGAGFEVTPLLPRALYDAICILRTGTCPDDRGKPLHHGLWSYARTSDIIHAGHQNLPYHAEIGGYGPRAGATLYCYDEAMEAFGVAPGLPAEVPQPLAPGKLAIGKGH